MNMKKLGKKREVISDGIHAYKDCTYDLCKYGVKCTCSGTPSTEYVSYQLMYISRMQSGQMAY